MFFSKPSLCPHFQFRDTHRNSGGGFLSWCSKKNSTCTAKSPSWTLHLPCQGRKIGSKHAGSLWGSSGGFGLEYIERKNKRHTLDPCTAGELKVLLGVIFLLPLCISEADSWSQVVVSFAQTDCTPYLCSPMHPVWQRRWYYSLIISPAECRAARV